MHLLTPNSFRVFKGRFFTAFLVCTALLHKNAGFVYNTSQKKKKKQQHNYFMCVYELSNLCICQTALPSLISVLGCYISNTSSVDRNIMDVKYQQDVRYILMLL